MTKDFQLLARKMDALGLWERLYPYHWAVKFRDVLFPYFCTVIKGERPAIKIRVLMLEGWVTFHEFVRVRGDPQFGVYSLPMELPHLELVLLQNGEAKLFRYDTGFVPVEADEHHTARALRILWEMYGLMLRLESEPNVLLKFVEARAIFARVEAPAGGFTDAPLVIPDPPPYRESISLAKEDLARAKDLPLVAEDALHLDFGLLPNVMTSDKPRARSVYRLFAYDPRLRAPAFDLRASIQRDGTLKGLWELMPSQLLKALIARGRIPGELKVKSGRVFRFIRALALDLPIKFSIHDRLEGL